MGAYSDGEPLMACAVCARILDYDEQLEAFTHTLADLDRENAGDHLVVPVLATTLEAKTRCDFCGENEIPRSEVWTVPAETFEMPKIGVPGERRRMSVGDWAACETCADLVTRNRWRALVSRVIGQHRQGREKIPKAWVEQAYLRLAVHLTGKPYHAVQPTGASE